MSGGQFARDQAEWRWRAYFMPDTTTLRKNLGIIDPEALRAVEYRISSVRRQQLDQGTVVVPRTFDDAHLVAVHRHLFGDVYPWAGQPRTVNMAKDGRNFADVEHEVMGQVWEAKVVVARTPWERLDREEFAVAMAEVTAHLNFAHPFREGNGRTTRVLLEHLAERTPFALDFTRVSAQVWNQASAASMPTGRGEAPDLAPLVPVFRALTVDRDPPSPARGQGLERSVQRSPGQLAALANPHRMPLTALQRQQDSTRLRDQASTVDLPRGPAERQQGR
ncbi:Fic family protein (plasmid) [Rhodococcus antarcticus]|uniref:protein adenylyltransferase n=1 Tax=Rhodococcus antarcticus TaxID=2987751 RepID=A0ABY6P594_9NOCA|nr:Fic family protein [Rhodococcus antarcticus]UZJ26836.1 Fic family protein [Rhodococcus antarcticus]